MKTLRKTSIYVLYVVALMFTAVLASADSGRLYTSDQLASSLISCIGQDKYGYVWIGTENGLSKFDGYRFTNYYKNNTGDGDSTQLIDNDIADIFSDGEGRLWIGCDKGLMQYDFINDNFKRYPFPGGMKPRVETTLQDGKGNLILGTAGYGLFCIRKGSDRIEKLDVKGWKPAYDFTSRIFKDGMGDIWFGSHHTSITKMSGGGGAVRLKDYELSCGPVISFIKLDAKGFIVICMYGILRYDYATGKLSDAGFDLSAISKKVSIRKAVTDHGGNIYIGTSGNGLMVIPRGSKTLRPIETKDVGFDLSASNVNDIFEDKDRNIWVSCYKRGLYLLSHEKNAFANWNFTSQNISLGSGISSMAEGDGGDIWVTVQKVGVYRFDRQGNITAQPKSPYGSGTIYRDKRGGYWICSENALYSYDPYTGGYSKKLRLDGWGLNCMTDDGRGRLFICNYGKGLCVYDTGTGKAVSFNMEDKRRQGTICNNWIKSLFIDSRGLLWIGSSNGLSCMDTRNYNFNVLKHGTLLRDVQCLSFSETGDGTVLIGTNNGLYEYFRDGRGLKPFPGSGQVRSRSVYGIVVDENNDIWLSTSRGIIMYSRKEGKFINYAHGNGLSANEYILGAAIRFADNRIAFGTNDGITVFYPDEVKNSTIEMDKVYLTNFTVNGKPVFSFRDRFELPYTSNSLQLEFSLLNFKHVRDIKFQYRINDSKTWVDVKDGSNAIQFNELKPGKYEIYVRAECSGRHSRETKKITIVVNDPWYSSAAAWVVYFMLAGCVVAYALWRYGKNKREELDEAKMRFLINATHDIRSPLTLILGPLNKLKQRITDKDSLDDIDTIDRNAQRLLLLVNQILDERRIDKNQMHLHCQLTELAAQVGGVAAMFQSNARQHGITLGVESEGGVYAWVDRTNFDKVIQNLLSNSFKFTPDGGDIRIILRAAADAVTVQVQDTGPGFSDEDTDRLFDRFYQGRNSTGLRTAGTGIGLNLCRTLVQMHGGRIKAANRADGVRGALVTITLRTGNSHLKPEEIVADAGAAGSDCKAKAKARSGKNVSVMVVDDDPEIAAYIRKELGGWYRLESFGNGDDALKALLSGHYDIVVSDIVMPGMDGIALLKSIKGNSLVSDVPVILLTSKDAAADRLEGFKRGADAYLPKPFDMAELRVMIDNLVDKARLLRGKYSGAQAQDGKVDDIKVKGNDDALMERIMKSVNKNLSNPDFNVENLSADVGISRAQLHRKMKEITGISAGEFIRNLRLEQAAKLICEDKVNITQVAYSVGFNNQTHFSTVFKKHFGMPPTEYASKHRAGNGGESTPGERTAATRHTENQQAT